MINDNTLPSRSFVIQTLEILLRNPRKAKCRVCPESEAGIIARIAQHNASSGSKGFYLVETSFYQPAADGLSLSVRPYGNWTETVPSKFLSIDLDWRESDMANNLTVLFCDKGDCQTASLPQGVNDGSLGSVAMRSTFECGAYEQPNFVNISRVL